jgi:hypothetical protein
VELLGDAVTRSLTALAALRGDLVCLRGDVTDLRGDFVFRRLGSGWDSGFANAALPLLDSRRPDTLLFCLPGGVRPRRLDGFGPATVGAADATLPLRRARCDFAGDCVWGSCDPTITAVGVGSGAPTSSVQRPAVPSHFFPTGDRPLGL